MPGDSCIYQLVSITHEICVCFDSNPPPPLDMSEACDQVWAYL